MAKTRGKPVRETFPESDESHQTVCSDLRTGDRVILNDHEPMTVLGVWPYTQEDFTGERHPEIPRRKQSYYDHRADEPITEVNVLRRGRRVSLACEDGNIYSVVRWSGEDENHLYLKVIQAERPVDARWDKITSIEGVERFGPEPVYIPPANPAWYTEPRLSERRGLVERAADGEFGRLDQLPSPEDLRRTATKITVDDEGPPRLSADDIKRLNIVEETALDYMMESGVPPLSDDPKADKDRLNGKINRGLWTAIFPDGKGTHVQKPPAWRDLNHGLTEIINRELEYGDH